MGLQDDIGYMVARPNAAQRALQQMTLNPKLSPILSRLVTPVDRVLHRVTRGRGSATARLVAWPTILLTTTGAKTGQPRSVPLMAVPVGEDLALIGSNGGSGRIPGWVHNLGANPRASISYREQHIEVVARDAGPEEYEEAFAAASRIYVGFTGYRERASYKIPIFVLTRANEVHEREEQP